MMCLERRQNICPRRPCTNSQTIKGDFYGTAPGLYGACGQIGGYLVKRDAWMLPRLFYKPEYLPHVSELKGKSTEINQVGIEPIGGVPLRSDLEVWSWHP